MDFTILILVLPLLSFLVLGLAGTKLKPGAAGAIGTVVLGAVTVLSYLTAILYFGAGRNAEGIFPTLMPYNAVWLPISQTLHIDMGILLDPISVMMLVVISTVSLMVHIYSFGYMKGERGFQRYYAFLSLFTMSMLGLVVATNIFQMYLFWELVGVSSYLLIGFYYTKPEAIAASKKAFIVTRFADLGFLIGILFYGYYAGTFSFTPDAQLLAAAGTMIPLALGLMFIGGAGKSAMFPLHIWLPDAMEGPTPVSALIHAATMVVAGVYLVARMFPLYIGYAPDVLHWVAYIGAFTALYAAVVACVQSDIKRVLAFSTISQIGFMLVALGVCTSSDPHTGGLGYMASMFHLFTHAMFKALLFLCAGCIIHAVHSNEMSAMGGMRKYMPVTHITFLVACLAIAGIWPLSGFFSKDEILTACFAFSPLMGWVMTGIAGLTAFYMFRLYYGIFWGKENKELHAHHTPHEAPATMTVPLVVLAVITCVAGFIPFGDFISSDGEAYTIHLDGGVVAISLTVAIAAIALATWMYLRAKQPVADRLATTFSGLHKAAYHRFYIDEAYQFVTHRIIFGCISRPIAWFDRHFLSFGHIERLGRFRADDHSNQGFRTDGAGVANDFVRSHHPEYHGGKPLRHPPAEPQTLPGLLIHLAGGLHHAGRDRRFGPGHDFAGLLHPGLYGSQPVDFRHRFGRRTTYGRESLHRGLQRFLPHQPQAGRADDPLALLAGRHSALRRLFLEVLHLRGRFQGGISSAGFHRPAQHGDLALLLPAGSQSHVHHPRRTPRPDLPQRPGHPFEPGALYCRCTVVGYRQRSVRFDRSVRLRHVSDASAAYYPADGSFGLSAVFQNEAIESPYRKTFHTCHHKKIHVEDQAEPQSEYQKAPRIYGPDYSVFST